MLYKADSNLNNDMDMLENMLADPNTSKELEEMVKMMKLDRRPKPVPRCRKPKESSVAKAKPMPKPRTKKPKTETESWSISDFEQKREELVKFVCDNICPLIENGIMRILVRAPVKSGKRGMVEYLAMRDKKSREKRVHAFVSAWHRAADKEQREELGDHNLKVFSIINDKSVKSFLKWLKDNIEAGNLIVVHLDECDHGSGDKQMLSKIWSKIRSDPRVTTILYSATPEEAMFSHEFDIREFTESHPPLFYTPPKGYCGSGRFLEEDLVHDAQPFFRKDGLSEQAKEILRDMHASRQTNPKRNLLILRLTAVNSKHEFLKSISSFKELSEFTIIVDKDDDDCDIQKEEIQWSSKSYWDKKGTDKPLLIVHNQTATRSTEWSCHDRVFATHDYREKVVYVVVSQAQERVNHYEAKYGGFQPIRVYGHKKTFQLSAGQIDYKEYIKNPWFKRKVDRRIATEEVYTIRNTETNTLHHDYDKHYTENEAIKILRSLMSYGKTELSNRLACGGSEVPVYQGEWLPITKETWDTDWSEYCLTHPSFGKMENPFINAEKHRKGEIWLGQHRGWKHLEFSEGKLYQIVSGGRIQLDLGSTGGDRKTVCYSNGQLGVFIARLTGERKYKPIMTVNSTYVSL